MAVVGCAAAGELPVFKDNKTYCIDKLLFVP